MSDIENDFVDHNDKSDNDEDPPVRDSSVVNISEDKQQVNGQTDIFTAATEACPLDTNGISRRGSRDITCHNCTYQRK